MNEPENTGSSPFLPVLLLALSILFFVTWQFSLVWKQQSALKKIQKDRNEMVQNSSKVQGELQNLAVGLLEVARSGDPDAVGLVQRYGISQQPTAPAAK